MYGNGKKHDAWYWRFIPPWLVHWYDGIGFVILAAIDLAFIGMAPAHWRETLHELATNCLILYASYWAIWWFQQGGGWWRRYDDDPEGMDPDGPSGEELRERLAVYRRSILAPVLAGRRH